jgi:hypothetical protein
MRYPAELIGGKKDIIFSDFIGCEPMRDRYPGEAKWTLIPKPRLKECGNRFCHASTAKQFITPEYSFVWIISRRTIL